MIRINKTLTTSGLLALAMAWPVFGRQTDAFGLGAVVGHPSALTGKYWINRVNALQAGIGDAGDLTLYADFLWHGWKAFPQPKQGKISAYLGLGARWEDRRDDEFGFRGITGVSYWIKGDAAEVFAEIAPVLRVTPKTDGQLDGGVGIRYYFKGFN